MRPILILLLLSACSPCWTARDTAQRSDCGVANRIMLP